MFSLGMRIPYKKGEKVTVLEWAEGPSGYRDYSYVGEVLEVVLVEKPFIIVTAPHHSRPIPLDMRRVTMQRISDDYADALQPKAKAPISKTEYHAE